MLIILALNVKLSGINPWFSRIVRLVIDIAPETGIGRISERRKVATYVIGLFSSQFFICLCEYQLLLFFFKSVNLKHFTGNGIPSYRIDIESMGMITGHYDEGLFNIRHCLS